MSSVRIALSYLTRGTWTYDRRYDTYPIGRNLNIGAYKPDGSFQAASTSPYDGFEFIEFSPDVSGYYLIRIFQISNNDLAAKLYMSLSMNYRL